uniref:CUB domain-containing protein n=1 Tax=Noctiluca scintillans TaxID=2966 RepID=A0A7S1FIY0_NOCSC|mmetsp:Transcript_7771/g.21270  ORF Transcript_7771/g.21270 Transcript_7771/m.21270 type:complete len:416 (+) Transcript_7771:48-1295(+)
MSVQLLFWVLDSDWLLQKFLNISSNSLRPITTLGRSCGFSTRRSMQKRCPQMLTLYLAVCVPSVSSQSRLLNLEGRGCARDIDPEGTECVSSLNYPYLYDNSAECRMYVVSDSVSVEIKSFNTENFYDVLEVTDAGHTDRFSGDCCSLASSSNECAWDPACGSFPTQLSANSMLLWSSDSSRVDSGWEMCFFITKDGSLVDVSGSGCFLEAQRDGTECVSSSNFPATYDNAGECEVQVTSQAVVMDVIAFETEPFFDVLTVTTSGVTHEYHGLCNTLTCRSFVTHLSPMSSLRWTADTSVAEKGWKICFDGDDDDDDAGTTTQEDTDFGVPVSFIGVVIGASCCCMVLCGAFCCLLVMALQKRVTAPATESVFADVVLGQATTVDPSQSDGDNSPGEAQQDNNDMEDNPDCAVPA